MKNKPQISLGLSLRKVPYLDTLFSSALIYTDKNNTHPSMGDLINIRNIVFSKEELIDDKWLILSPLPPNPNFQKELKSMFYYWRRQALITIQTEGFIKEEIAKMDQREREIQVQSQAMANNYKYTDQTEVTNISPKLIVSKYKTLQDFQNDKNNWAEYPNNKPAYMRKAGNLNGAETTIVEHYKPNDEIWHYSEWSTSIDLLFGSRKELFLLIRNGKIVCSPIVDSCT